MREKVRWGILGVAGIAVKKVIPAMQKSGLTDIYAIASRDLTKAEQAAQQLGISRAYGSYEELLADPDVQVVYNPLPNHLHVPWSIRAAEAGKHVLCEKPLGLSSQEARDLIAVRDRTGVAVGEAFMVATHPQWLRVRQLVQTGAIGELRAITGHFSYFNLNAGNIRNISDYGGGALMDIGCYPIFVSRFVSKQEPRRVSAAIERDPGFGTDRLTSALMDFPFGHSLFTCSTQLVPAQRMQFFGTKGRIEVEIPFNAPPDRPCRIFVDDGSDLFGAGVRVEEFPAVDQYTLQGDAFSQAIAGNVPVPVPLEDSLRNLQVIEALFRASTSGRWEDVAGKQ